MSGADFGWNPWHGCKKYSEGCANCYVYRIDSRHGRNPGEVFKTKDFDLPVRKSKKGEYKIPSGATVYTCFSSDFLLDTADEWRSDAFEMMKQRSDVRFLFLTKRIERLLTTDIFPDDWGDGYDNVAIGCTCESIHQAQRRLPVFESAPIKHKFIICEPLLDDVATVIGPYLRMSGLEGVIAGGESGENARICRYEWVLGIRDACASSGVNFTFKQTGAKFEKDGRIYQIKRKYQHEQAKKARVDYIVRDE